MASRAREIADALVEYFTTALGTQGGTLTIERRKVEPVDAEKLAGRRLWVFSQEARQGPGGTRENDQRDYPISVVVMEVAPEDKVTESDILAWADEVEDWVWDNVFEPLSNYRLSHWEYGGFIADAMIYPQTCEIAEVCNEIAIDTMRMFWSQIDLVLREETNG